MTAPKKRNVEATDDRVILEAYRLAEQNLQSQVDIALAADQRATTFCGLVVAALAALVGLSGGQFMHWATSVSVLLFAAASVLSVLAIRPVKFYVRGLPFENFKEDIEAKRSFIEVVGELSSIYDKCLKDNDKRIISNARFFRNGLYTALGGIAFLTIPTVVEPAIAATLRYLTQGG